MNVRKILQQNLTQADVVSVLLDDAQDTYAKCASLFDLISQLYIAEEGDYLDQDEFLLISELVTEDGLTWVDADGDVIQFVMDGDDLSILTQEDSHLLISQGRIESTQLFTTSGEPYSAAEALELLSMQTQSCEFMSRLAGLASKEDLSITDVQAAFSDMLPSLSADLSILYSQLMALGDNITPAAVLSLMLNVYRGYEGATATDTYIHFAEDTYFVKAFYGTVVREAVMSGIQVLSTILLVTGGIVGKILGLLGSAIAYGFGKIEQAVIDATRPTMNYTPSNYEFAKPVKQGFISKSYCSSEIKETVDSYGIALIKSPYFNMYVFNQGISQSYGYEIYLNLMVTEDVIQSPEYFDRSGLFFYEAFAQGTAQLSCYVDKALNGVGKCNYLNASLSYYDSAPAGQWFAPLSPDSNDETIRTRVLCSALVAWYGLANLKVNANWTTSYLDNGITLGNYNPSQGWNGNILAEVAFDFLTNGDVPNWVVLTNEVLPALTAYFNAIPSTSILLALANDSSSHRAFAAQSAYGWVRPVARYRSSFLCVPPAYTPDSLLQAISRMVSVTMITAAVGVATTIAVKRRLSTLVTKRSAIAAEMWDNYTNPASPHYRNAEYLNSYIKVSRKNNLLSRLTGVSAMFPLYIGSGGVGAGGLDASQITTTVTDMISGTQDDSEPITLDVVYKSITFLPD